MNIDVTVFIGGHHGDCSKTFLVRGIFAQFLLSIKMSFPEVTLKLKNGLFPRWARWTLRAKRWWKLERELLPQVGGNQNYFHA